MTGVSSTNKPGYRGTITILIVAGLLLAALARDFHLLWQGLYQPLLDIHSFRQTQTALTVYWLMHGGPWLAYETPVLGAPWSIPFEFPIFQMLTALLAKLGIQIDAAGRLINFAFYLGTLLPLWWLYRTLRLGAVAFIATAILYLTAPIYAYWSRTFLIESTAVFFGFVFLAAFAALLLSRRRFILRLISILAGTACVLSKGTTFPAFAILAVCLVLWRISMDRDLRTAGPLVRLFAYSIVAIILPLAVGVSWTIYSDSIKAANPFGALLTTSSLRAWNFGTLDQRLSAQLWVDTIANRALRDTWGYVTLIPILLVGAALAWKRTVVFASALLVAFIIPFLLFSNLHIIHNYYQYANAVFLVMVVGIGVSGLLTSRLVIQRILGIALLFSLVASQTVFLDRHFTPEVTKDRSTNRLLLTALKVRAEAKAGSSVIVFGDEWASTIPFYSERKSLVIATWFPPALVRRVLTEPQSFLGDAPLGAVVLCRDQLPLYKELASSIDAFAEGAGSLASTFEGCEVRIAPAQSKLTNG